MIPNMRQWRKAYMLEFLKNDVVAEVFTFSVPPESENFDFPQRITETPTFGGVVIDDYGNDTVKIRLSGSTINEERKLIYRGNKKLPSYMTGEKEIFALQKIFEKWGEFDNIPGKKVYLYDLSKMSLLQIGAGTPVRNYWRIIHKDLKIKRAKDRPFTFLYELEAIGIIEEGRKIDPLFGKAGLGDVLNRVQHIVSFDIEASAEFLETVADIRDTAANEIAAIKRFVEQLQNGNLRSNAEAILRKLPGGNNLWNMTKSFLSTVSKMQYLARAPISESNGSSHYSGDDEFTVSFNSGNGSYVSPIRVHFGNLASKPVDPVLDKFSFSGWFTGSEYQEQFDFETTEIVKNITLYAKWTQIEAVVTFNSRQGSVVQSVIADIGECITAPESPVRQGYEFEYWCTDPSAMTAFDFSTPITGDITLYARWKTVFVITFQSNGGSAVPLQTAGIGGLAVFPVIPEREHYLFVMWCSDITLDTEYNFELTVDSNITLYAKWTRITNDVLFESNGGSAVPAQVVTIGGHAIRPPDPIKLGHAFQRWCSDSGLTQEFLFDSVPVNYPTTIYARWLIDMYTVQFDSNGGTDTPNQSVDYQGFVIFPPIPAKDGALFLRWCSDRELSTEFDFSTPLTENITLYADWYEGAS